MTCIKPEFIVKPTYICFLFFIYMSLCLMLLLFCIQTAYFDYLASEMIIVPETVPETIPRIDAWTDDLVEKFVVHYPKFKDMQVVL